MRICFELSEWGVWVLFALAYLAVGAVTPRVAIWVEDVTGAYPAVMHEPELVGLTTLLWPVFWVLGLFLAVGYFFRWLVVPRHRR